MMKSIFKVMGLSLASPVLVSFSTSAQVAVPSQDGSLQHVRKAFPAIVRQFEVDCGAKSLEHRLNEEGDLVLFTCWDAPEASGSRSGAYLGKLPLSATDPFRLDRLACRVEDQACQTVRKRLRTQFPQELETAEFACSARSGILFFANPKSGQFFQINPEANDVELRCGFQQYIVTDDDGDGEVDHESSAGVDRSVLKVSFETAQKSQKQEWDAFFSSQYTYWDAKVLAEFWNQDVGEAKARIGRKLLWGNADQAILEQFLMDARIQALDSVNELELYGQSGYTYDDAQALANFWGDATPYDAKLRIERNLIMGNEQVVKDALQFANQRS